VNTWFLRKPNGDIYGPVEQSELVRWASTDRIAPDDEVSADRKEWLAASRMPGLKLCWMIEWPDGHHAGPYHVSSLAEMLADGELDGNESVRHVHTKDAGSLLHTLQTAMLAGELHLSEGALTAALCGMMRGQADEALVVNALPSAATTAAPVAVVEKEPEALPVKPATVAVPVKSAHPQDAIRIAVPAKRPTTSMAAPVVTTDSITAAQAIVHSLTVGARTVQTVEQQLAKLPAALQKKEAALAAARDELTKTQTVQESQTKLAQQAAAESAQKIQTLQAEADKLRGELATLQKSSTATAQQQTIALQQMETQLKAACAVADETAKKRTDLETERGLVLKQRDALQGALDMAQKKALEQESALATQVEASKKIDAQLRAEIQIAVAAKATLQKDAETRQRDLEDATGKLAGLDKDLATLRSQSAQQGTELRQVRDQLAAKQLQLDVAAKQLKDLDASNAALLKQRDLVQSEREAALKKAAEAERLAEERRKAEAKAQAETQTAIATRETAQRALEGVRQELDATTSRLAERDFTLRQHQQQVSKLEGQLVEVEAALADTEKQLDKAEAAATDAEAALEAERESDVLKRAALQQERDNAVERAEERGRFCEEISADKRRMEQQLRGELKQAQGARDTAQREREEAERALESGRRRVTEMEQRGRHHEQQILDLQTQLAGIRQECEAGAVQKQSDLTTQLERAEAAQQRVTKELQQMRTDRDTQEADLQKLRRELDAFQRQKTAPAIPSPAAPEKAKADVQHTEADLQQARTEQKRLEKDLQDVQADRKQLESALQQLRHEMEDWRQRALAQQAVPMQPEPKPAAQEKEAPAAEPSKPAPAARPTPSSDLYCLPRRKLRDDF